MKEQGPCMYPVRQNYPSWRNRGRPDSVIQKYSEGEESLNKLGAPVACVPAASSADLHVRVDES